MATSVLMKMKRAMKSSVSTEDYLHSIYNSLKREINNNAKKKDDIRALKLQAFLRQIKYMQYIEAGGENDNFPFAEFWKKSDQIALMNKLQEIKPEIFTSKNFLNISKESQQLGMELEIGVARVVKSMGAIATGQDYAQSSKSIVGGAHTQIPDLIGVIDQDMKNIFNQYYTEMQKELKKYQNNENMDVASYTHSVQGKIDNIGLSGNLVLSSNLTKMEKDIIDALTNATFTDKNYVSTTELKFGQTNPFRVFMTVAPRGGGNALGYFCRMLNCFENHSNNYHTEAPKYFYRIRAIYELTGARMQYTEKSQEKLGNNIMQIIAGQPAKYLIWNNPLGEIYVIPTSKIVNNIIDSAVDEVLPKNWRDALFGPIVLPQKDLSKL